MFVIFSLFGSIFLSVPCKIETDMICSSLFVPRSGPHKYHFFSQITHGFIQTCRAMSQMRYSTLQKALLFRSWGKTKTFSHYYKPIEADEVWYLAGVYAAGLRNAVACLPLSLTP